MLAITLGDPFGVSIELVSALLADRRRKERAPVTIIGSAWQWRDQVVRLSKLGHPDPGSVDFIDIGTPADAKPAETLTEAERGGVAVRALERLRTLKSPGRLAVVTGPIDKHAATVAGFRHPGQTEFFEELWGAPAVMTLAGQRLRVGLATNHVALRDVPRHVTKDLVIQKGALFVDTLRDAFGIEKPRVAVCGVNPHASDQGLFGDEEARAVAPAVGELARRFAGRAVLSGPLPADTAFHHAYHGTFDGVLAMYHDQGLGPLKTVHFDDAVNLSGGLPHFRAAPDHGPARDLFLQRKASPASFAAAVDLALAYLESRS